MHAYYPPEPQYTFLPAAGPIPAVVPGPYAAVYDGYGPGASGQYYGGAASNYYDDDYSNSGGGGYGPYGARQQPARDTTASGGKTGKEAQKPAKGSWKDSLPLLRKKKPDQATPQKQGAAGARGRSPSPVAHQDATPADAYYYNGSGGDQYSGAYTGYTGAAGPGYDYSNGYGYNGYGYGYDQPQKPAPATTNNNGKKRPLPPPVTRLQDVLAEDRRAAGYGGYGGYGAQQQSARSPRRQIGGAGSQQQRSAPSPRKPSGYEVEPYAGPFGQHPYDDRSRVLPGYGPSFGYGYGYGAANPNPAFGGQYGGYGLASFGAPQYAAAPPVFGAPAPAAFAASPYAGMGGGYATGWGRPW